jgi:hypothetical protein
VREDLSPSQQAVQCSHVAIEAATIFDLGSLPDHPYLVILAAKNEARLHRARQYLIKNGIRHAHFYESDLGNSLTALATEPIPASSPLRELFKKYQLIKPK